MEGRDAAVLEQHVVERELEFPVRRRPVFRVGRDDDDVAVETHLLAVVLADVRVVPVRAGIAVAGALLAAVLLRTPPASATAEAQTTSQDRELIAA